MVGELGVAQRVGARVLEKWVQCEVVVRVVDAVEHHLGVGAEVRALVHASAVLGRLVVLRDGEEVRRDVARLPLVGEVVGVVLADKDDDVAVAHGTVEDDERVVGVVDDVVDVGLVVVKVELDDRRRR